ncbi:MAG TPA: CocE/NonD family hydrolase, partial [Steroidobacteraceae bacterium]|nr:CocE/NonD family hydrolase [Steroidobacteraceae bacterium]
MKRILRDARTVIALLCTLLTADVFAQAMDVPFHAPSRIDEASLDIAIPDLANRVLGLQDQSKSRLDSGDLFWIEIAADKNTHAYTTIRNWRAEHGYSNGSSDGAAIVPLELYVDAQSRVAEKNITFDDAFRASFRSFFTDLDDKSAYRAMGWLGAPPLEAMRNQLADAVRRVRGTDRISVADAVDLCRRYALIETYQAIAPLTDALIGEDRANRYVIDDDALIKTPDGATINAIIVRPRVEAKLPTALQFTIYTYPWMLSSAIEAAAHGYVGVVGFTRGKRHSPDAVVPYERDGDDARALIEWISRQPWSDGRVGMYGASYNGFTQWAAVKHRPAALKTIVPYCPNDPGYGLPMTNNVFLTANYAWPFYVTNGKDLDEQLYSDNERWSTLGWKWYRSGRPYREIDQVDGLANPWLQRWIKHPAYDSYWQAMTANGDDYAKLDIPV